MNNDEEKTTQEIAEEMISVLLSAIAEVANTLGEYADEPDKVDPTACLSALHQILETAGYKALTQRDWYLPEGDAR